MTIENLTPDRIDIVAPLVAEFRVALMSYKGIEAVCDVQAGKAELTEYFNKKYPIFIAFENGKCVGYVVCRIDEPCVWVESIFVIKEYRRNNIATALFAKAEEVARGYGEETLYNYVHPNNKAMIAFLQNRGYNFLNLIEVRKAYVGETPTMKIKVGDNEFDY